MKVSRTPPCLGFPLTIIDEEHAVMFGGVTPGSSYSADVYVLHLPTMVSGLLLHITLIVCLSAVVPVVKGFFISKTMNIDHYSDMRCTAILNFVYIPLPGKHGPTNNYISDIVPASIAKAETRPSLLC